MSTADTDLVTLRLLNGKLIATIPAHEMETGEVELRLGGKPIATATITSAGPGPSEAILSLPASALSDGVALLDLHRQDTGAHLARYTMFNGAALPTDLVSTVELLRAEVQALKRAFMDDASIAKLRAADRPLVVAEAVEETLSALESAAPGTDPLG